MYALQNLVLCFRLHFTKDSQAVINTAGATVRQLVALVFERVIHEDEQREQLLKVSTNDDNGCDAQQQKNGVDSSAPSQDHKPQQSSRTQPLPLLHHHNQFNGSNTTGYEPPVSTLGPCAADAYHMFQVYYNNILLFCFFLCFLYPTMCLMHTLLYIAIGPCAIGEHRPSILAGGHDRNDQNVWPGTIGICAF